MLVAPRFSVRPPRYGGHVRCTSCNEPTRVLETRRRPDGATRRRRECTECGRRFSTEEHPDLRDVLGEIPESTHAEGGPLEAVRRRAIIAAALDENRRQIDAAMEEIGEILEEMREFLRAVKERHEEEARREKEAAAK